MNATQIKTLEQVRPFLDSTLAMALSIEAKEERDRWVQYTLARFYC